MARIRSHKLCTHTFVRRETSTSSTDSTDEDIGWGGLGVFEYGKKDTQAKGLIHALVHVHELLETGGHHGAFCTSLAEAGHKQWNKRAGQFSRVYRSRNSTQDGMLTWVLRQILFSDVFVIHERAQVQAREVPPAAVRSTLYKFGMHLSYTDDWQDMQFDGSLPVMWRTTFLSRKVLISREELLVLLRTKLQMDPTVSNLQRILKNLHIQCFGTLTTPITPGEPSKRRKLVGIDSTHRRDFVRVRGSENNTALACQVRVYAPECVYTHRHFVYV